MIGKVKYNIINRALAVHISQHMVEVPDFGKCIILHTEQLVEIPIAIDANYLVCHQLTIQSMLIGQFSKPKH